MNLRKTGSGHDLIFVIKHLNISFNRVQVVIKLYILLFPSIHCQTDGGCTTDVHWVGN